MKVLLMVVFTFISISLFSQETPSTDTIKDTFSNSNSKNITGTITDSSGTPLFGVNILVKNTSTGTQTNQDGQYAINVKQGDTLVFSYVGMRTLEAIVEASNDLSFSLEEDAEILDAVVLDNSKTITKEEKASSYGSVEITGNQISKGGFYTSIAMLLQERGITPRGQTTIYGKDMPLFVVDGVPISQNVGDIDNLINAEDIVKINVVRGTFGYAKYGGRAIGGVIEITTKFKSKPQPKTKKKQKE
jgi:CarboxypepD_reg-like domain/TonB-dependent Receptor Plug Domain